MPSYPQEKKCEILVMMERDGVTKTFEETHIARTALYKSRHEAKENIEAPALPKKSSRKKMADLAAPAAHDVTPQADNIAAIKQALLEDDGLREKVQALEAENAKLRDNVDQLKKLLLAAIEV